MHWARENPDRVKATAFMEAFVPPAMPAPSMEALGEQNAQLFTALRTPGQGEEKVLGNNFFVEEVLGKIAVATPVAEDVLSNCRAPFVRPESRKPTLVWPREVPIGGEPASTTAIMAANGDWLTTTAIPKLMFAVTPGALTRTPVIAYLEADASDVTTVELGAGVHFVQEDHPDAIGRALDE